MNFRQQNTVGHQFDAGVFRHLVVETNLEADHPTQFGLQLMRDAVCHRTCRHPARLGVGNHSLHAPTNAQADFRQLRGFAGAGLAAHNDDLVTGNRLCQIFAPQHHRQVGGILKREKQFNASRAASLRGVGRKIHGARLYRTGKKQGSRSSPCLTKLFTSKLCNKLKPFTRAKTVELAQGAINEVHGTLRGLAAHQT